MDLLQTILATIVTLGLLVTIHEWGHFYVARRCGIKVLRFSIGFGKALFSWKDKQGTVYAVAAIPLGGYVKMLDEREAPVPEELLDQAFNRKSVLQRIAVVAAGPLVNLIFAVFAYWLMFIVGVSSVAPIVGGVATGSYAEKAGVMPNAEIISVDGFATQTWDEVNLRLASRVGESGELTLVVLEKGTTLEDGLSVDLVEWAVDLEKQSPISALGIMPWRPDVPAIIGRLSDDGRAKKAGLQAGDKIIQVDGVNVSDWYQFVGIIQKHPEVALDFLVERDSEKLQLIVTPAFKQNETGVSVGFIGAGVQPVSWPEEYQRQLQYDPISAIGVAFDKFWQMVTLTLDSIWKMIEGVISVKNLSGPITIAKVAGASAASGFETFVSFLAYLSISLGILNLLPIPVLDGGHLLYYLIELVRGKPVSEKVQLIGFKVGMTVLLTLMIVALFNDFMRL